MSEPLANKYGPSKRQQERNEWAESLAPHDGSTSTANRERLHARDERAQQRAHDEAVRSRLGWIVGGVWVIAGAVIANFIAALVIGAAAGASSVAY